MIFMTSNVGAGEMSRLLRPNLGFASRELERQRAEGRPDDTLTDKITRAGVEAARRKFTPEFMNRIDKTVVFRPLGDPELRRILILELNMLQQRIFNSPNGARFVFLLTDAAKEHLLCEGTDVKYGARHLKRAIDRSLVHPLSNLIATEQVRSGDLIRVEYDPGLNSMSFFKEAEDMPQSAMMQMVDTSINLPLSPLWAAASVELPRATNVRRLSR
jgi:ATP-dependent Clp protease ATP-binding subunit ClpA